jgi:hypothetical protein
MTARSGTENRRLRHKVTVRLDDEDYDFVCDRARSANASSVSDATVVRDLIAIARQTCGASHGDKPVRRRVSRREPLPVDVEAVKSLAAQLGQTTGALVLLADYARTPVSAEYRADLKTLRDQLIEIKGHLVALVKEATS